MTAETDTLAKLRDCLAHLDEYVTRRARELAHPLIDRAEAEADERVRAAEADAQRCHGMAAELGRRLDALERQQQKTQDARGRLAALLGGHPVATNPAGLPSLEVLVAEVETALQRQQAGEQ